MGERLPLPYPNGWFRVCESEQLGNGDVKPIHYFGEDFVLFRDEGGVAHVLDAYCPHMGAHLGHGGAVEGDTLRCPFHAWRFDGKGKCVEVPYAKRIPAKAEMASHQVCEKNGIIMLWHDAEGRDPWWQLPDVPELESDEWTRPVRREWRVRSHAQEQMENICDPAHFQFVHGTPRPPEPTASSEGHIFRLHAKLPFTTPRGEIEGTLDIESHGFGMGVTRFSGIVDTTLVITGSQVDDELHETIIRFMVKKLPDERATSAVGDAFIAEIEKQYGEDIPIWENKVFLDSPMLCDGDGPIGMLRNWATQFMPNGLAAN